MSRERRTPFAVIMYVIVFGRLASPLYMRLPLMTSAVIS